MSCNTISTTVGMHSINKIYFLNLYDYFSELAWKLHASLFMHKHPIVVYIKIFSKPAAPCAEWFSKMDGNEKQYINKSIGDRWC